MEVIITRRTYLAMTVVHRAALAQFGEDRCQQHETEVLDTLRETEALIHFVKIFHAQISPLNGNNREKYTARLEFDSAIRHDTL